MPTEAVTQEFDHYKVYYITSTTKPYLAVITCYYKSQEVGMMRFVDDGQKLSRPKVSEDGKISIDFHLGRFGDIHNILLHESPLVLYVSPDAHWGSVTTSTLEPIGEMEPSAFVEGMMNKMKQEAGPIDPNIAG